MKKNNTLLILISLILTLFFSNISHASRGPRNDQEVDVIAQPGTSGCRYEPFTTNYEIDKEPRNYSTRGYYNLWGNRSFRPGNVSRCRGSYLRTWITGDTTPDGQFNHLSRIYAFQGQEYVNVYIGSSGFTNNDGNFKVGFTNIQPSSNTVNGIKTTDFLDIGRGPVNAPLKRMPRGFTDSGLKPVPAKLYIDGRGTGRRWNATVGVKDIELYTLICNRFRENADAGSSANVDNRLAFENARNTAGWPSFDYGGDKVRCDDFGSYFELHVMEDPNKTRPDKSIDEATPTTEIIISDDVSNPSSGDGRWKNSGVRNARVGQKVFFKHQTVANISRNEKSSISGGWRVDQDDPSGRSIVSQRANIGFGRSINGTAFRHGSISSGQVNDGGAESAYIVKNEDVGKTICRRVVVNFKHEQQRKRYFIISSSGRVDHVFEDVEDVNIVRESRPACFYVPYHYELKPCVNATQGVSEVKCGGDIAAEPSERLNIVPMLSGAGTPIKPGTRYAVTKWEVSSRFENHKTPLKESFEWGSDTCLIYRGMFTQPIEGCAKVSEGLVASSDQTFTNPLPEMPEDAEFGRRYCVGLSIAPYRMLENEGKSVQDLRQDWRHSAPICAKAVKKPKMRIWNNGVYSQAGISTSRSSIKGGVFGSWVEYEAISGGRIAGLTTESSHSTNRLTFSNAHTNLGNFGFIPPVSNNRIKAAIESRFPRSSKDGGLLARDRVQSISNGEIVGMKLLPSNITRVIYGGDVTISGDQENSSIGQQTIIIANNIFIKPNVRRIDALLIADKVVTCANGNRDDVTYVSISNCDTPLVINGAVLTNNLKSYRTFGDYRTGEPAEIYNYRPDMYFWAKGLKSSAAIRTTYTKELPVRY